MARLNRETFGRRGPTNVIAFPMESQPPGDGLPACLGDVVISLATTARQAQEHGWTLTELCDFYLIHGILHLVGYDHAEPEDKQAMEAKTWEILTLISDQ
jgi:probable rRNA maturation factor